MKQITLFFLAAGIALSACTMPDASQDSRAISTAAALTVQAALASAPANTPLSTPTLAQPPVQAHITPTFSQPMIAVGDVINCRSGPGKDYDRVAQVMPNEPVKIIGFFPPAYWVVYTVNGECWLSAEFVTPSGNFAAVPTVTAPPTPIGGVPAEPTFGKNGWEWFCNGTGQTDVTLSWKDNADTEKGYRVYRNGELAAEFPANSTYFKETIAYPGGQGLKYTIEAFNEVGSVSGSTDVMFCD